MGGTHKFPYEWKIADGYPAKGITYHGMTVFSCFACGGGSTMGYKLAGYNVIGCNEIDPKMAECYKANHDPRFCFVEPIQTFKLRNDLPPELYDLDILDGSPPCSSFSMAGNREKDWGKDKKFREGQAEQVLDTLFFDFIDLAERLRPKVVVAENVKGMLLGEAQKYVDAVLTAFDKAGYFVDFTLLDASNMGVPQRRERVFFTAIRKDLYQGEFSDLFMTRPLLDLAFDEKEIPFESFDTSEEYKDMPDCIFQYWTKMGPKPGPLSKAHAKGSFFGEIKADGKRPLCTITSQGKVYHHKYPRRLNTIEFCCGGSYPLDYQFLNTTPFYLIGMSVPPVMMAQIAARIKEQWLDPIHNKEAK
jgi:DNA (cytosine-5)-methyltransferase 1